MCKLSEAQYLQVFYLHLDTWFKNKERCLAFFQVHPNMHRAAVQAAGHACGLGLSPQSAAKEWFDVAIMSLLAEDARTHVYRRRASKLIKQPLLDKLPECDMIKQENNHETLEQNKN